MTKRITIQVASSEVDPAATIVAAVDAVTGTTLGAVRSDVIGAGAIPLYLELHRLGSLGEADLQRSTVSSGWTVAPGIDFRQRAHVPQLLAWKLYELAMRHRYAHDFLDCPDERVPFFLHLGYKPVRHIYRDGATRTNLMRLDVYDWPHLTRVKSPFLDLAKDEAS